MDKFKTKAGRLTPYALACGYIETKEVGGVTAIHNGSYRQTAKNLREVLEVQHIF